MRYDASQFLAIAFKIQNIGKLLKSSKKTAIKYFVGVMGSQEHAGPLLSILLSQDTSSKRLVAQEMIKHEAHIKISDMLVTDSEPVEKDKQLLL